MPNPLEWLLFIIAGVEIAAETAGNEMLRFCTKPLLMILLIIYYATQVKGNWNAVHKLMVVAFFFSWIGDVALMFVGTEGSLMGIPKNPNFFLAGLVGFLITHVLYAVAFSKVSDKSAAPLLKRKAWVLLPLIGYMIGLLYLLLPAINGKEETKPFLAPVIVYSTAIATMVVMAINRYGRVNYQSFALAFTGALLFMVSDSIIAISKFLHPFEASGIFIMALYVMGQYLIAKGTLAQFQPAKN